MSNIKDMLIDKMDWNGYNWEIDDESYLNILEFPNGEITDGDHSFNQLYYHRMKLFAIICNQSKWNNVWKSWKHYDGTMYDDYFIVGIGDENGFFSYHYHKDYWNEFDIKEIEKAPKWSEDININIDGLYELI